MGASTGATPRCPNRRSLTLLTSFYGRIGRGTYWMVSFLSFAVIGAAAFAPTVLFSGASAGAAPADEIPASANVPSRYLAVFFGVFLINVWIGLATQVKRWHDRDKASGWVGINLIPIVGRIWAFVELFCLPGTPGPSRFGPPPA